MNGHFRSSYGVRRDGIIGVIIVSNVAARGAGAIDQSPEIVDKSLGDFGIGIIRVAVRRQQRRDQVRK